MIVAMNPARTSAPQGSCPRCRKMRSRIAFVNSMGMGQSSSSNDNGPSPLQTASGIIGDITGLLSITAVVASFFKGCGSSCVLTSTEANQVGNMMSQNLSEYMTAPVSAATQTEALANFDQLWAGLVAYCSQPSMSSAGQRCISDRQQGSCAYKTSPGGWQQQNGTWTYVSPGANGSGSTCWNYFVGMRDPIANDPRVAAASAASSPAASLTAPLSAIANTFSGLNLQSLLLPAGLIVGGLVLASVLGDM